MLKKVLTGTGIAAALTAMFFLGSLALGSVFAQAQPSATPTQAVVQSVDDDDATEAAVQGPDTDLVEEQVGDQNELDNDDATEAAVQGPDTDLVEEQVGDQTGLD